MNAHPKDEFDGIFDDLSPQDFSPDSTATFPAESNDFDEFVHARLEGLRPAFAPGKSLTHAALSNDNEVRQLVPTEGEETVEYLARLTRHARNMHAHSFFFCRITDSSGVIDGSGFCVLWIAHHLGQEGPLFRSGIIPIENGELGEINEADPNIELGSVGEAFTHVLMQ